MLDAAFQSALSQVLPASSILVTAEETRPYECDGLTMFREQPRAVVLPDDEAQIVAENSGGVHCLKYGLTVHNIRRVRAVLVTGDVVEFGNDALDAPGYDLLALITGSEGLLAVTTEVTVKLTPKPVEARCVLAAF